MYTHICIISIFQYKADILVALRKDIRYIYIPKYKCVSYKTMIFN